MAKRSRIFVLTISAASPGSAHRNNGALLALDGWDRLYIVSTETMLRDRAEVERQCSYARTATGDPTLVVSNPQAQPEPVTVDGPPQAGVTFAVRLVSAAA